MLIQEAVSQAMKVKKFELYATSLLVYMDWKSDKFGVKIIDFGGCQQYPEALVQEKNDYDRAFSSVIEDFDVNIMVLKSQILELEKLFPDEVIKED